MIALPLQGNKTHYNTRLNVSYFITFGRGHKIEAFSTV